MIILFRAGWAAKIGAFGQDRAPSAAADVPAIFINRRRERSVALFLANDFWFLADISFPPLAALIIGIHITELRVGCQSKSESECDLPVFPRPREM